MALVAMICWLGMAGAFHHHAAPAMLVASPGQVQAANRVSATASQPAPPPESCMVCAWSQANPPALGGNTVVCFLGVASCPTVWLPQSLPRAACAFYHNRAPPGCAS